MSDSGLLCLVYVSRATVPMQDPDLLSLLRQARQSNAALGITGMLLFREGRFMQALEGPHEAVRTLYYDRIARDVRHTDVTTLIKFRTFGRAFDGWTMGFSNVDRIPEEDRDGFNPFLQQDFNAQTWLRAPHQAVRLLKSFRDMNRLVQVSG